MDQSSGARNTRALCLLSWDSGGVGALSSLLILREIMRRVNGRLVKLNPSHQTLYPWQVFDMMSGTGLGGIAVIMLGRLRMPIEDVIGPYLNLSKLIVSEPKWWSREARKKPNQVKRAVNCMVGKAVQSAFQLNNSANSTELESDDEHAMRGERVMMYDPMEGSDRCPVFVCDVSAADTGSPTRLRTYSSDSDSSPNRTIWEAASTTSIMSRAHSQPALEVPYDQHGYISGSAIGHYNPTTELLHEAFAYFSPDRHLACVLSIGMGRRDFVPKRFRAISIRCERVHQKMVDRCHGRPPEVYFRFNVESDLGEIDEKDTRCLEEVHAHTLAYTANPTVSAAIDRLVGLVVGRRSEGMWTVGEVLKAQP